MSAIERHFLSIPEAAVFLDIHPRTAQRLFKAGKFPVEVVKIGSLNKVPLAALREFARVEKAS